MLSGLWIQISPLLSSPLQPGCWMGWFIFVCSLGFQPCSARGQYWAFSGRNLVEEHAVFQVSGEVAFWPYVLWCPSVSSEHMDGPLTSLLDPCYSKYGPGGRSIIFLETGWKGGVLGSIPDRESQNLPWKMIPWAFVCT